MKGVQPDGRPQPTDTHGELPPMQPSPDTSGTPISERPETLAGSEPQSANPPPKRPAEHPPAAKSRLEHDVVGDSEALHSVLRLVERVAPTDLTVLISGESGTGKELIAKALHRNSPRRHEPFVAVNCATLSETLLESELFGHERGAFTGAVGRKLGQFELAHRGTLFLDEVAEIPVALQAKLLRALESREIQRVGGDRPRPVEVRVVAATNRDLAAAVSEGTFRRDLYHRLDVFSLELPPLRERRSDIPQLATHFAARTARRLNRATGGLTASFLESLAAYDWPGNVRELRNAIERAVVLATDGTLRAEDLPEQIRRPSQPGSGAHPTHRYHEAVRRAKRKILIEALERAGGDRRRAAETLDLNRTYLYRLISKLGLPKGLDFKGLDSKGRDSKDWDSKGQDSTGSV